MTFSQKLTALRKKEGFTQETLAEKLDISRQAVSRWEMGSAMPDAPNLLKLSRLFGVSADYLLDDEMENEEAPSFIRSTGDGIKTLPLKRLYGTASFITGLVFSFLGAGGLAAIYVLSTMIQVRYDTAHARADGSVLYTSTDGYDFFGFIEYYRLEALSILCLMLFIAGAALTVLHILKNHKTTVKSE